MKLYKAYNFRTKDPEIDNLRTIIEQEVGDRVRTLHLRRIEEDGGPSTAAMRGWFFGKTRRPQSAALEAAGRAMGYRRAWVRLKNEQKG